MQVCDQPVLEFGEWDVSNDDYHADVRYLSASALEIYRQSPALYRGRYITKQVQAPEPSESMRIGSALHCLVLEPERFEDLFAIEPNWSDLGHGNSNKVKEAKAAFRAEATGKTLISRDDLEDVRAMVEAICQHPKAKVLLGLESYREHSIRWQYGTVPCKTRFDMLIPNPSGIPMIVDLKTARDPSPEAWRKTVANFGYHRQAAFYQLAHEHHYGRTAEHIHLVVRNEPPYEVAIYQLDADAMALGRRQVIEILEEFETASGLGVWSAPWQTEVMQVSLPPWA